VSGLDIIQFAPEMTAFGPATLDISLGELVIDSNVEIQGPMADS